MIYDLGLAWRNLRSRPVETLISMVVVALAIVLSVAVITVADGAQRGIVRASDPFGMLVIGATGSGQDLVLSSILLQGLPLGNIDFSVYESLQQDERVQLAVPLAFGDSVRGQRIVGTNLNFFQLRASQLEPVAFQIREGRLFGENDTTFEAVLGSEAAQRLGLKIGDKFRGTHGVGIGIAENEHDDAYTVVGILAQSFTAYDNAIYTHYQNVWEVHHEEEEHIEETNPIGQIETLQRESEEIEPNRITAVLVLATGFVEQNQIFQEFYVNPVVQAVFPGQELSDLIRLIGQGQQILTTVGYLVLGIAMLTVFLSLYNAIQSRKQAIAIMRSLGSRRMTIVRVVLFEALLIMGVGTFVGNVLGLASAWALGNYFSRIYSFPIQIRFLPETEILLWGIALVVGLLAGLIPALLAYRVNVIENLFPL